MAALLSAVWPQLLPEPALLSELSLQSLSLVLHSQHGNMNDGDGNANNDDEGRQLTLIMTAAVARETFG